MNYDFIVETNKKYYKSLFLGEKKIQPLKTKSLITKPINVLLIKYSPIIRSRFCFGENIKRGHYFSHFFHHIYLCNYLLQIKILLK